MRGGTYGARFVLLGALNDILLPILSLSLHLHFLLNRCPAIALLSAPTLVVLLNFF